MSYQLYRRPFLNLQQQTAEYLAVVLRFFFTETENFVR